MCWCVSPPPTWCWGFSLGDASLVPPIFSVDWILRPMVLSLHHLFLLCCCFCFCFSSLGLALSCDAPWVSSYSVMLPRSLPELWCSLVIPFCSGARSLGSHTALLPSPCLEPCFPESSHPGLDVGQGVPKSRLDSRDSSGQAVWCSLCGPGRDVTVAGPAQACLGMSWIRLPH